MSDRQTDKPIKKTPARNIALIGAGASALAVLNMATNGPEAPSEGVVILQYLALAGGLLALVGGLIMMAMATKE
jgi:hypothetical protein